MFSSWVTCFTLAGTVLCFTCLVLWNYHNSYWPGIPYNFSVQAIPLPAQCTSGGEFCTDAYKNLDTGFNTPVILRLVLLTNNAFFHHEDVWVAWAKHAYATIGPNALDFVVHHHISLPKGAMSIPHELRSKVHFADSAKCKWGRTNPCMHAALLKAVQVEPPALYYAYVSAEAVPVLSFPEIAHDLLDNYRSRFAIINLNFVIQPKSMQWVILRNDHAQWLALTPERWINCGYYNRYAPGGGYWYATDDEICLLRALESIYTDLENQSKFSSAADNKSALATEPETFAELNYMFHQYSVRVKKPTPILYGGRRPSTFWEGVNSGITPPAPRKGGNEKEWKHSYQHTQCSWGDTDIGKYGKHKPREFEEIYIDAFEKLFTVERRAPFFFARKFKPYCAVLDTAPVPGSDPSPKRITLSSYLIRFIHLSTAPP